MVIFIKKIRRFSKDAHYNVKRAGIRVTKSYANQSRVIALVAVRMLLVLPSRKRYVKFCSVTLLQK